jgi:hypothetical protein
MPFSLKMAINKYQIPAQKRIFEKIFTKNSIEHTITVVIGRGLRKSRYCKKHMA